MAQLQLIVNSLKICHKLHEIILDYLVIFKKEISLQTDLLSV